VLCNAERREGRHQNSPEGRLNVRLASMCGAPALLSGFAQNANSRATRQRTYPIPQETLV